MNVSRLTVILCVYMITPSSSEDCIAINSCSCRNSKGTIDLKALGKNDGTAAYADQPDGTGAWFYSYNPCKDFSEGSGGCDKVAACQTDNVGSYFSLGDQASATFQDDPTNGLQIVYSAKTDTTRTSYVTLKCDETTESFTADGENPPGSAKYYFTLSSAYACPRGVETTTTTTTATTTAPSPRPAPTPVPTPAPTPAPSPFFTIKMVVILLGCVVGCLAILICLVFVGLVTRRSSEQELPPFHDKRKLVS